MPRPTSAQAPDRLRVQAIYWNSTEPGSVSYTIRELFDHLPERGVERALWCLNTDENSPRSYEHRVIPKLLYRGLCKLGVPMATQGRLAREVPLASVRPGDIVYVWPPYDLRLIRRAQARGAIVVAERINCMGEMCRDALSRAYARRGLPLPAGLWTPEAISEEREQMSACDFVTAPNPCVVESLRVSAVPDAKILETSYGYSASRLASAIGIERPDRAPVFAFVGAGEVRKGLDVLLDAWELASLKATLLIAGQIAPDIQAAYQRALERPDVRALGFVNDIATVYAAADVFVFPSHEEGGPQVTYEAAACGLASIVSPMGAGRIIRNGTEGLIVDPLDVTGLARALKLLADDQGLRRQLGGQASERAREFEWSKVGSRLYEHFRTISSGESREPQRRQTPVAARA